jgi:hypothetical protein
MYILKLRVSYKVVYTAGSKAQAVESSPRIVRRMRLERLVFGIACNHARVMAVIDEVTSLAYNIQTLAPIFELLHVYRQVLEYEQPVILVMSSLKPCDSDYE